MNSKPKVIPDKRQAKRVEIEASKIRDGVIVLPDAVESVTIAVLYEARTK